MEKNRNLTGLVIGIILIAAGIFSLLGRFFTFINWDNLWPLFIVGTGVVFFVSMVLGGKTRGGLAIPASILVTVGLILLVMNSTGRWEAWSYAWALIIAGSGFGTWINGIWSDQPELRKRGQKSMVDGLTLFLIVGAIMEFIFSATGVSRFGNILLWAALLAVLGFFLLVTRLLQLRKADGERVDLFWPVVMIGAGLLAVLTEIGWLPEKNLLALVNLWPILLIVAGLDLLLSRRSAWVGASLGVFVVAAIFMAAFAGERLGLRSTPFWSFNPGIIQIGDLSGKRITGSNAVVTVNRQVSSFEGVSLEMPAQLEIRQGTTESLTITGEDNILPLLVTEVSSGRLSIRFQTGYNIRANQPIQVNLTVKNLKELSQSSSGNIIVGPIHTDDFQLALSSSGDIKIEEIQADSISAKISSSGDTTIAGTAGALDLRVSSSGDFHAGDLQVQDATINISSSGKVTVWVLKDLNASISSSGDIRYYGSPSVHATTTSSGDVKSIGEK